MPELLEFDPVSEEAANSPLSVMTANYRVTAHSYASPEEQVIFASSVDTEGELVAARKVPNRTITMTVEMVDATGSLTRALQAKVAKIRREGGTLKRTLATGQVIVFDLLTAGAFDPTFDLTYYSANLSSVDLTFTAKPYGRGSSVTLSSHAEATLPCLVFTESGITGDVPALGRLVITEAQAVDQWWLVWGLQSRYYSSSATAGLFYEAEGRTAMGGSSTVATGSTSSGSSLLRNTSLATSYQAILSTQATGGGAHLSHVGTFQVFARCAVSALNAGVVSVALEWAAGDFRRSTRNADVTLPSLSGSAWSLVDLGQVSIPKVKQGAQQWEGRIVAKSTVGGDDVDVDYLMLVPVLEGSGRASGVASSAAPTAYSGRDEFSQTAGALAAKTATVGGTWAGAGSATDFSVTGSGAVTRATASEASLTGGRFAVLGTTTFTNAAASIDFLVPASPPTAATWYGGVITRYIDANNWFGAFIANTVPSGIAYLSVIKYAAGVGAGLGNTTIGAIPSVPGPWTIRLEAYSTGRYAAFVTGNGSSLTTQGFDSALATGGALASGKSGIFDNNATTAFTRTYDNYLAWVPVPDAAVFASRQAEIRDDSASRADSTGTTWSGMSSYEGDYLLIPPAGAEGRTLRMIVKATRGKPEAAGDSAIDDISAQLTYTPRYLVIP